jgi:hypothetical protein
LAAGGHGRGEKKAQVSTLPVGGRNAMPVGGPLDMAVGKKAQVSTLPVGGRNAMPVGGRRGLGTQKSTSVDFASWWTQGYTSWWTQGYTSWRTQRYASWWAAGHGRGKKSTSVDFASWWAAGPAGGRRGLGTQRQLAGRNATPVGGGWAQNLQVRLGPKCRFLYYSTGPLTMGNRQKGPCAAVSHSKNLYSNRDCATELFFGKHSLNRGRRVCVEECFAGPTPQGSLRPRAVAADSGGGSPPGGCCAAG